MQGGGDPSPISVQFFQDIYAIVSAESVRSNHMFLGQNSWHYWIILFQIYISSITKTKEGGRESGGERKGGETHAYYLVIVILLVGFLFGNLKPRPSSPHLFSPFLSLPQLELSA